MRQRFFGRIILSSALAACVIGPAFADSGLGNETAVYTEVAGLREFTGQMTARPIQPDQGANMAAVTSARKLAKNVMDNELDVIEYVWQTDEYIFHVPEGMDENEVATTLMETGAFEYVEPNWMVYPSLIPNDSRINSQWHHKQNRVNSYDAWDLITGDPSVVVAICDTGVKTTHEDLLNYRQEGYNTTTNKWENNGGAITDINGHGTWTTGTAAANGNNGKGVSGMGFNLGHRMMRVTNSSGGGAYISDLTEGARTAIDAGDKCASVSYGGAETGSARSAATYCKDNGGLCFWSAGNESNWMSGSRDNDDLIVVGSTTSGDSKSSFSNYGPYVDLMAPGSGIYTTDRSNNSSYGSVSGTSFSCPMAAGVAAMIFVSNPSLTPDEVEQILKDGCDDLGSSGVDDTYGYGRVNTYNSIASTTVFNLRIDPGGPVYAQATYDFIAAAGTPFTKTGLFYSIKGTTGTTWIGELGLSVDMKKAKKTGGYLTSDASGNSVWHAQIPNHSGLRVWIQSAQEEPNGAGTTNIVRFDIE